MAFQQPTLARPLPQPSRPFETSQPQQSRPPHLEESQEWILFSPASQAESTTQQTGTSRTLGLSRLSEDGSAFQSGLPDSSELDEEVGDDEELDSLDDGLQAFREPALYHTQTQQTSNGPVLPAHDGLGSFQASSAPVLEQLWQHEQFNPKRKHEGHHRSASSVQRQLEVVEDFEAQANDEKRMRIEKWRLEQSQALIEEVERETRQRIRRESLRIPGMRAGVTDELLGTTPKQSDYLPASRPTDTETENEPFWRRITRKFIRDVIGIDEPLLSVILGESLPGEFTPRPSSPVNLPSIPEVKEQQVLEDTTWRDRVLQRIAKELGVFVHQLTPHPGAFTAYQPVSYPDYAGMPVTFKPEESPKDTGESNVEADLRLIPIESFATDQSPNFPPTIRDPAHADNWGFEEEPAATSSLNIRKEREYWERELDVKMVFRYLKDRFATDQSDIKHAAPLPTSSRADISSASRNTHNDTTAAARRAAIIRQHHPLVARAHHRSSMAAGNAFTTNPTTSLSRLRRDSGASLTGVRRPGSSCASESLKSNRRASALKSGSSRHYWDIGGSIGSGSGIGPAGGPGLMGAWGEV